MHIAALVATKNRPALLQRALDSITAQTRRPNTVVLVNDEAKTGDKLGTPLASLPDGIDRIDLQNRRESGASGSWNTGIDEIARRVEDPTSTYVAILDDDDWWDNNHLLECINKAEREDADVVAARIHRYDDSSPDGRPLSDIPRLCADLALVRNTGIQGSNLFIRLSTLLEAGCFDESLPSTTDRDLVIRLADLGARFEPLHVATVHHDARGDRNRLSTPGSQSKTTGLQQFQRKYRRRMTADQRIASQARAAKLFSVDVNAEPSYSPSHKAPAPRTIEDALENTLPLYLVVGITADGDTAGVARVSRLLNDLQALQANPRLATLDVILIENGHGGDELDAAVDHFRKAGLHCRLAQVEQQCRDAANGLFGPNFKRSSGRVGIADARTMTQRYAHLIAPAEAVVWILDDDKRLSSLTLQNGRLCQQPQDTVSLLLSLRDSGTDIVLGIDTGAAPLPASMTLRVQLVDLQANLAELRAMPKDADWPERLHDNLETAKAAPTAYYHDLARDHTRHLETPFGFQPSSSRTSVRNTFLELCSRAPRILAGEQVFRPLFIDKTARLSAHPSVQRGGNTVFMNLDALVDVPQSMPETEGRPSRRSDMVSAILNSEVKGRHVELASFAVYHDRTDLDQCSLDIYTLVEDIRGFALYSALKDLVAEAVNIEAIDATESARAQRLYEKYLRERTAALTLSLYRARGAARTAYRFITDDAAWWWSDPTCTVAASQLRVFLEATKKQLDATHVQAIKKSVFRSPDNTMELWLGELGPDLKAQNSFYPERPGWLGQSRVERARSAIERLSKPTSMLTLLGHGDEGVVFTDGQHAFKYLDRWLERATATNELFLRSLVGAWTGTTGLLPLVRFDEGTLESVLVMPYVSGAAYKGGHGRGIVSLLRECCKFGIACRNLHPKNLLVVGEDVRLIDYGIDIRPLDADEWRHMVRRAWLCWRWTEHTDLGKLMTRALSEELPEVYGWQRLERAVLAGDAKEELDGLVLRAVLAEKNRADSGAICQKSDNECCKVLDFGCGSGELASRLADVGKKVIGYDPHASHRWSIAPNTTYTTKRDVALAGSPYDTVICSLVLCTLDNADYLSALSDLRNCARDGGQVIIAVCHPFHTRGGDTTFQRRVELPDSTTLSDDASFAWIKRVQRTGNVRRDVHRPLHVLRRDLLRAGILVESTSETSTVDLERFEPTSDFLVLHGRAVSPGPEVSLLIRASALEWRTLELQIRHLIRQLESPRAFCERLVVLDSRTDGFTRAYDTPDLEAARTALNQLVADGTIDLVVEPPADPEQISALHERWFGLPVEATHTTKGAPVTSALAGFEACSADYVLHIDDDLMILRKDPTHDYLSELADALAANQQNVAVSLNIVNNADQHWTHEGPKGSWGVEVRGALLHRTRLLNSRLWPNDVQDGQFSFSWHRSFDRACAALELRSLRGGQAAFGFVHPPNATKNNPQAWLTRLDRIEQGYVPDEQAGQVEIVGSVGEWLCPKRTEPLVVVACGRNVPAGRIARFRDSLHTQSLKEFGLVVVEDGGSLTAQDAVRHTFAKHHHTTILTLPNRRGALENLTMVLRNLCSDSNTIVVLVDLDDALLGANALANVKDAFDAGHDLAVGGMRRTDKTTTKPPCFDKPRSNRGGSVWQHLRAFRRSLFDSVPDSALRDEQGQYYDLASDWALMIALTERADAPLALKGTLYLHEPSGYGKHGDPREEREHIIGRILAMPSLKEG